jgi:tRNA-splicing ligase RtcB
MPIHKILPSGRPIKIWTDEVEPEAEQQLRNLAQMPFIHKHVAVMPDVHAGKGSTIGSVIATKKALIPAAVGVDIGCGMMAVKLPITADQLPDSLAEMRAAIEKAVPHGRTNNGRDGDRGAWGQLPLHVDVEWRRLHNDDRWKRVREKHPHLENKRINKGNHLGTLGTGNHFVEVCIEHDGPGVWVMLHSGSRGIGNAIGTYFIDKAKEEMERWHIHTPDPDLAYLPEGTWLFKDYWDALSWGQEYARSNRELMMMHALGAIQGVLKMPLISEFTENELAVNCHHNYAAVENHFGENVFVTRKGAVRAREGDLGIIPGSMGAKSFIVRGKGNPDSFCSCSHGAGRKMSRTAAKKRFTVEDLKLQTSDVECRKDSDVVDEIPGAYKDIDVVMANQSDLVEIVATLKQVLCVKG